MAQIRGWNFPVKIDEDTGRIMTAEDNENIKQSIRIILLTQLNERKIIPGFGTNIRSFMFEVVDPTFVSDLKKSVSSALRKWEANIRSLNVSVSTDKDSGSNVIVNIDYITTISPVQERVSHKVVLNK